MGFGTIEITLVFWREQKSLVTSFLYYNQRARTRPSIMGYLPILNIEVLVGLLLGIMVNFCDTSLAAKGALAHRLQNPKWLLGGPKMEDGV